MNKRNLWWIAGGVAAATIVSVSAAVAVGASAATPDKGPHIITYEVTGTTASSITMNTAGNGNQLGRTELPFRLDVVEPGGFAPVGVTAQTMNSIGGIGCRILVDGKVRSDHHSDGAYVLVTCVVTKLG